MYLHIRFYLKCLPSFLLSVPKQPPEMLCGRECSGCFCGIREGAPVPGSIF